MKMKKIEKSAQKKSSPKVWKKIFAAVLFLLLLFIAGVVGYFIGNEDSRDDLKEAGEKVSEVGGRLGEWGRDVGKSTKKLFD